MQKILVIVIGGIAALLAIIVDFISNIFSAIYDPYGDDDMITLFSVLFLVFAILGCTWVFIIAPIIYGGFSLLLLVIFFFVVAGILVIYLAFFAGIDTLWDSEINHFGSIDSKKDSEPSDNGSKNSKSVDNEHG